MKKLISRIALVALLFVVASWGTGAHFDGPAPPFCPPDQPKCLPS
jgi:hypothetical protein